MDPKKKSPLAMLILEHAKKKSGASPKESDSDEYGEVDDDSDPDAGLTSAMDDLIEAVHGKDTAGAVAAYKALRECE